MLFPLLDTPGETPQRGPVQVPGELRALALAQAAERLARRDPAAVQGLGCLHAPVLGDGQQHVEDLRGLQVRWRVEQQRADRHPAGLEVALELRAKRTNLVGPAERVDALIQAALGCRPMLERVLVGERYPGRDYTCAEPPAAWPPGAQAGCSSSPTGGRTRTARSSGCISHRLSRRASRNGFTGLRLADRRARAGARAHLISWPQLHHPARAAGGLVAAVEHVGDLVDLPGAWGGVAGV